VYLRVRRFMGSGLAIAALLMPCNVPVAWSEFSPAAIDHAAPP